VSPIERVRVIARAPAISTARVKARHLATMMETVKSIASE